MNINKQKIFGTRFARATLAPPLFITFRHLWYTNYSTCIYMYVYMYNVPASASDWLVGQSSVTCVKQKPHVCYSPVRNLRSCVFDGSLLMLSSASRRTWYQRYGGVDTTL